MPHCRTRTISLPPELNAAIVDAAAARGLSVSAWIADAADRRLRLDAGLRNLAEWEGENSPLSLDELASALERAREVVGGGGDELHEV